MDLKGRLLARLTEGYIATLVLLPVAGCTHVNDLALANSLANDTTRQAAVASIVASDRSKVPLLLSWARKSPVADECGLFSGLADAFGQLKTREAIPFLIEDLSEYRSCGASFAPWLNGPKVIEWNLPAVGALIKIGPEASKALIAAFPKMTKEEDRRAAVFVVSRINGVPEAGAFLQSVLDQANRERYWAEKAVKSLRENSAGR